MDGQRHCVTFSTHARARHFASWDVAADACRAICDPSLWHDASLLAWVLMPDHWHGLVALGSESLGECIGRLKGRSGRRIGLAHPQLGPIWAAAYQTRALREAEDSRRVAGHLLGHPVRAGMVSGVADYPFWDARWVSECVEGADAARAVAPGPGLSGVLAAGVPRTQAGFG